MKRLLSRISVILKILLLFLTPLILILANFLAGMLVIYFFVNLFLEHFEWWIPLVWLGIDLVVIAVSYVITVIIATVYGQ